MIRPATIEDAETITEIYNHYVLNTIVTFENCSHAPATLRERMARIERLNLPWIVAEDRGEVVGYAYANRWRDRDAYKKSVEISVYLHPDFTGKGWGSELMGALLKDVKERGYHVAIGGIALPNTQSVALHEKFGMEKVAHFEQVGLKFNRWIDVGYWQICFDTPPN